MTCLPKSHEALRQIRAEDPFLAADTLFIDPAVLTPLHQHIPKVFAQLFL